MEKKTPDEHPLPKDAASPVAPSVVVKAIVISLRIIIGVLFVVSGFAKAIDPWGTVYKISEYFTVWDIAVTTGITTTLAFLLSTWELVWGALLLLGCYRRVAVVCLLLMMAVMLPLTLYIAIANPVADCGCFGDLWVISNTATFVKNILITAALIYLLIKNVKVDTVVYSTHTQWIVGGLVTFYALAISLYGYNVQPLEDFRRFAPGKALVTDDEDVDDAEYTFIYERDGESREFSQDNLPDSTWTFVDRRLKSGSEVAADGLAVMVDGEDILPEIISDDAEQFIVTIPDLTKIDISISNTINDLNDYIEERGGSLVTFMAGDDRQLAYWADISMASYDIYQVESNLVKELARGTAALVYLNKGVVKWKRTISSIDPELTGRHNRINLIEYLNPHPGLVLLRITAILIAMMLITLLIDFFIRH
ncbi:MAG: DoxX family protein [Lachnoclostridium sp.]|nr:DoxX family protein [Lachnoclostridium sp.]